MSSFPKGVAVTGFTFGLINRTTGLPVTTGTTTGYVTKDGGVQAAMVDTPVHEGNGQWSVNISAAEMNADMVGLVFANGDAINKSFTIRTGTVATVTLTADISGIYVTDLATARNLTLALYLEAMSGNPKITYSIEGESYQWGEYLDMLLRHMDKLNALILAEDSTFEVVSETY